MTLIAYSASRVDLFFPCQRGQFFPDGLPSGFPNAEGALCAEMSRLAYCRSAGSFAFDQNQILTVLNRIGFTECRFFESQGREQGRGTHCFFALNNAKKLAVAAFRGTDRDDPTDLTDDAKFTLASWETGGQVHVGFAGALAEVRGSLDLTLPANDWRLLITGHSLGAALATLLESLHPSAALYTIGSPRVGDGAFVASLQLVENHRYVDCYDVVTRVPLPIMGYEHLGQPQYIDRTGGITPNPSDAFVDADRIAAVEKYLLKYLFRHGNVGARELADHAPINYVSALMGVRSGD